MEFGKYRRNIMKKYYLDQTKYIEELEQFNDLPGSFWDTCSGQFKISNDNKPNLRRWNTLEKKYDFYCYNSKHFTLTDPDVKNPQSIQYESIKLLFYLKRFK